MDLGEQISYLTLADGAEAVSSDGEMVGTVKHVLADEGAQIFDGIVIDLRGGGLRFVDAPEVAEIRERGIVLALPASAVGGLPEPGPNPAVVQNHGTEDSESPIQHKLRRAWDLISGRG